MGTGTHRFGRVICFFALLCLFSGFGGDRVHAQNGPEWDDLTHCTISGQLGVIFDYNCDGWIDDLYYVLALGYDPETGRLYPFFCFDEGEFICFPYYGGVAMTLEEATHSKLVLRIESETSDEGAVVTGDGICGSNSLNHVGVRFWSDGMEAFAGEGTLVDTTGDRTADSILLGFNSGAIPDRKKSRLKRLLKADIDVVMTEPLYYHQQGSYNFWFLPCDQLGESQEYFVPVDSSRNLLIECGDKSALFTPEATVDGDGRCLLPVPALTGWGYAGLIFLILASGIWVMRRRGFGRGLAGR